MANCFFFFLCTGVHLHNAFTKRHKAYIKYSHFQVHENTSETEELSLTVWMNLSSSSTSTLLSSPWYFPARSSPHFNNFKVHSLFFCRLPGSALASGSR